MIPISSLLLAALPFAPLGAQQPDSLTAADYARAERFLGANTFSLVSGIAGRPVWLEDGRFWYRVTTADGAAFHIVNPARRTRAEVFDHTRLAAALASATGASVQGSRLPFQSFDMARDGRSMTLSLQGRRWSCDLQAYTCTAAEAEATSPAAPPNSPSTSAGPPTRWRSDRRRRRSRECWAGSRAWRPRNGSPRGWCAAVR